MAHRLKEYPFSPVLGTPDLSASNVLHIEKLEREMKKLKTILDSHPHPQAIERNNPGSFSFKAVGIGETVKNNNEFTITYPTGRVFSEKEGYFVSNKPESDIEKCKVTNIEGLGNIFVDLRKIMKAYQFDSQIFFKEKVLSNYVSRKKAKVSLPDKIVVEIETKFNEDEGALYNVKLEDQVTCCYYLKITSEGNDKGDKQRTIQISENLSKGELLVHEVDLKTRRIKELSMEDIKNIHDLAQVDDADYYFVRDDPNDLSRIWYESDNSYIAFLRETLEKGDFPYQSFGNGSRHSTSSFFKSFVQLILKKDLPNIIEQPSENFKNPWKKVSKLLEGKYLTDEVKKLLKKGLDPLFTKIKKKAELLTSDELAFVSSLDLYDFYLDSWLSKQLIPANILDYLGNNIITFEDIAKSTEIQFHENEVMDLLREGKKLMEAAIAGDEIIVNTPVIPLPGNTLVLDRFGDISIPWKYIAVEDLSSIKPVKLPDQGVKGIRTSVIIHSEKISNYIKKHFPKPNRGYHLSKEIFNEANDILLAGAKNWGNDLGKITIYETSLENGSYLASEDRVSDPKYDVIGYPATGDDPKFIMLTWNSVEDALTFLKDEKNTDILAKLGFTINQKFYNMLIESTK